MVLPRPARRELIRLYQEEQDRLAALAGRIMADAMRDIGVLEAEMIDELRRRTAGEVAAASEEAAGLSAQVTAEALEVPAGAGLVIVEPDWRGPFTFGWAALDRGDSFDDALASAAVRADASGKGAVVSSARQSAAASAPESSRWRRVPDADPCDWCILVSQQAYASATSADFGHDRCGCTVWPDEVAA